MPKFNKWEKRDRDKAGWGCRPRELIGEYWYWERNLWERSYMGGGILIWILILILTRVHTVGDIDLDIVNIKWSRIFVSRTGSSIFWYPQNCKYCAKYVILGVLEMALPVPETKIWDHFYRPNTPPKPRKNTSGSHFCQSIVFFWPFLLFCIFCLVFRV